MIIENAAIPAIEELRARYHKKLQEQVWYFTRKRDTKTGGSKDVPSNAGQGSRVSVALATALLEGAAGGSHPMKPGQTSGMNFRDLTKDFIAQSLELLSHVRPGPWVYDVERPIHFYDQYRDLAVLQEILDRHKHIRELRTAFGPDYIIKPDIVVGRCPLRDDEINEHQVLVQEDQQLANLTPLRAVNNDGHPILHASISCKWTLRSDRAQNARTEALNLLRFRKGSVPHIVVVTGEPMPTRLQSLALGTGDVDCVYHMALYELQQAVETVQDESQAEVLHTLVAGRRLRDISDLPFDLAV